MWYYFMMGLQGGKMGGWVIQNEDKTRDPNIKLCNRQSDEELKFMFSMKATQIKEIFTQIDGEDFVVFVAF